MSDANGKAEKPPDGREPLGSRRFRFACHPGVFCFTACCRRLDLLLYPYDVILLKRRLGLHSAEFLSAHALAGRGDNPFFPSVWLKMAENEEHTCPFLEEDRGCTVYEDRPSACRTYPLERGVAGTPGRAGLEEVFFMTGHPYCRGHEEKREWSVREWLKDQRVLYHNKMNDLWAEMDRLFRANPWQGEGAYGPRQRLAFMVAYNIDDFRSYVADTGLLAHFKLPGNLARSLATDDEALMKFGFDWLKWTLAGIPTLKPKGR